MVVIYIHLNVDPHLIVDIFKTSLPAFKALRYFECVELPEMREEFVQALLNTHKDIHGLGLLCVPHSSPNLASTYCTDHGASAPLEFHLAISVNLRFARWTMKVMPT